MQIIAKDNCIEISDSVKKWISSQVKLGNISGIKSYFGENKNIVIFLVPSRYLTVDDYIGAFTSSSYKNVLKKTPKEIQSSPEFIQAICDRVLDSKYRNFILDRKEEVEKNGSDELKLLFQLY